MPRGDGRRQQLGTMHHGDVEAGRGELVMMPFLIWLLLVTFVAAYAVALSAPSNAMKAMTSAGLGAKLHEDSPVLSA